MHNWSARAKHKNGKCLLLICSQFQFLSGISFQLKIHPHASVHENEHVSCLENGNFPNKCINQSWLYFIRIACYLFVNLLKHVHLILPFSSVISLFTMKLHVARFYCKNIMFDIEKKIWRKRKRKRKREREREKVRWSIGAAYE